MIKTSAFVILILNCLSLYAICSRIFLQTNWNDIGYVIFVGITVGTPILSAVFSLLVLTARAH